MLEEIIRLDQQFFLWLNQWHSPFWDEAMAHITARLTWVPLYALLIGLLVRRLGWRQGLTAVAGLLVAIVLADQLSASVFKPFFARLRPSHEPALAGLVHRVGGAGGRYGFVSSHAANTFALAAYVWWLLGGAYGWLWAWAAVVSYSRIYVGVHYPLDIVGGALLGVLCGWLSWWLYVRWTRLRARLRHEKSPVG